MFILSKHAQWILHRLHMVSRLKPERRFCNPRKKTLAERVTITPTPVRTRVKQLSYGEDVKVKLEGVRELLCRYLHRKMLKTERKLFTIISFRQDFARIHFAALSRNIIYLKPEFSNKTYVQFQCWSVGSSQVGMGMHSSLDFVGMWSKWKVLFDYRNERS